MSWSMHMQTVGCRRSGSKKKPGTSAPAKEMPQRARDTAPAVTAATFLDLGPSLADKGKHPPETEFTQYRLPQTILDMQNVIMMIGCVCYI